MSCAGLHGADLIVLTLYLTGTTALGVWVGRGSTNIAEFFMPRRFGKTMMIMSAFGLEIPSLSRVAVIGFVAGWAAVTALIGGFVLIVWV